ncbi:MAG: hypothetical protein A4E32_00504 [Methanomassiliicoccales archaeon PtaU1.Bin124]|nr:MAG: hypothetical protein A4E32_00504 [Methanomassiliicoccales archaeon PtaU1.Bin124]
MEVSTEVATETDTCNIDQTGSWVDSQKQGLVDEYEKESSDNISWYLENPHCNITMRMEHLQWLINNSNTVKSSFTIFIDLEFRKDGSFRFAHLKMWNSLKHLGNSMDIWNPSHIQEMIEILEMADYIFVYGRQNDYRVLKELGLNIKGVLLKTIDIQDYYLCFIHRGYNTLGSMSRFYGGEGKYYKKSSHNSEVRKQCIQDVNMLEFLVIKTLNGEILIGTAFEDYFEINISDPVNESCVTDSTEIEIDPVETNCPVSIEDTMSYVCASTDSEWRL